MQIQINSQIKSITTSAVIRKKDGRVIDLGVISHSRKSFFARAILAVLHPFGLRG